MIGLTFLLAWLSSPRDDDRDRGDVPGWVMVTVMSAILVVAILAVFGRREDGAARSADPSRTTCCS